MLISVCKYTPFPVLKKKKLTFFTKFFLFLGISRLFLPSESQKTGLLETKWNVFQQN